MKRRIFALTAAGVLAANVCTAGVYADDTAAYTETAEPIAESVKFAALG